MADVRMPDGTIIRNVPEGTTRSQLMARYGKHQQAPKTNGGSFGHGLADSLTLGFLDEAGSALDSLVPDVVQRAVSGEKRPNIWSGSGFRDAYSENLNRNRDIMKAKQAENPGEFLAGQIGGALVPFGAGKGKVVQALTNAGAKAGKVGKIAVQAAPDVARGAIYGAGSADGNRAQGALQGAGAGLAGHGIGRSLGAGASRVLKGKQVSPAVRELADAGVVMTPGQRAGPGSVRKGLEEGLLGSIPLVKNIPNAAKRRGVEQLNVAAINKALEPIGFKVPTNVKPGRELIQKA